MLLLKDTEVMQIVFVENSVDVTLKANGSLIHAPPRNQGNAFRTAFALNLFLWALGSFDGWSSQ